VRVRRPRARAEQSQRLQLEAASERR